MKKHRIISFVLTMILTLTLWMPVSAMAAGEQTISDDLKREFLLDLGVPNDYVESLPSEKLTKMYEILQSDNFIFAGLEEEIVEIENTDPRTREDISPTRLKLTIATFDALNGNNVKEVYVSTGFTWLTPPIATYTDALTFNWDGSLFSLAGFYAMSTGFVGSTPVVVDNVEAPARSANGGVGWYIDLADPNFGYVANAGAAEFRLLPKKNIGANENLNSDMHLNYAHSKFGLSISFGLDASGPSVGVSIDDNIQSDTQGLYYVYH